VVSLTVNRISVLTLSAASMAISAKIDLDSRAVGGENQALKG
jgi:hypothetical protein